MDVRSEPLTAPQVRILGVLVEKELATSQSYPLTEKALLAGCNQTTNREPVVAYDTSVLRPALIRLRERGLTRRVRRAGERADKHAHRLQEQLGLSSAAPLAVLSVLLLRGPQTPGELRARTQRLHPLPDADALHSALTELADRGFAVELPRQPGEKQARWRHLLDGADEVAPASGSSPAAAQGAPAGAGAAGSAPARSTSTTGPPGEPHVPGPRPETGPRVAAGPPPSLGSEHQPTLAELHAAIASLQQRVSALEEQLARRGPPPAAD